MTKSNNVLRPIDPTKTKTLRDAYARKLRADLFATGTLIEQWFADPINWMGEISEEELLALNAENSWSFQPKGKILAAFRLWISRLLAANEIEKSSDDFITKAYENGASKAEDYVMPEASKLPTAFRTAFRAGTFVERLAIVKTKAADHIRSLKGHLKNKVIDRVAQGLIAGESPRDVGRDINKQWRQVSKVSATRIARTEVIRAHNEGALDRMESLGVKEIGVEVEWSTTKHLNGTFEKRVCPLCRPMEGLVLPIERAHGMLPRHPNCLLSSKVNIFTADGWIPFHQITLGQLVLTHKGRFKRVLEIHKNAMSDPVSITEVKLKVGDKVRSIRLTSNHRVRVGKGWRKIGKLKPGDKITQLVTRCKSCSKVIPYRLSYCSQTCQWQDPEQVARQSQATTEQLNREYAEGIRDGSLITEKAHNRVRELVAQGKWNHVDSDHLKNWVSENFEEWYEKFAETMVGEGNPSKRPEARERVSEFFKQFFEENPDKHPNYLLAQKAKNGDFSSMTDIERITFEELSSREINVEYNYPVGRFWIDFAIPEEKIAIECDGAYWHPDPEKDRERDSELEEKGWTVIRFPENKIKSNIAGCVDCIERVLKNHRHEYEFKGAVVLETHTYKKSNQRLYNLSVEDDESYVIKDGSVVHNCRCSFIPVLDTKPSKTKIRAAVAASVKAGKPKKAKEDTPANATLKEGSGWPGVAVSDYLKRKS